MKKNTGFNNQRTFGVEIEFFLGRIKRRGAYADEVAQAVREQGIECYVEGYNHRTRPHWKIVTDCSVSYEGLEIVSPVLKGQDGFNQLEKVLKALNQVGAKVDRTCGIHVHHDANDFSLRTFKNLYGMYARYEDCIDELVAKSRRGSNNRYCQSPRTNLERLQNAKSVDEIISRVYPSRYIKLNCQSFRRHGTIEFRQHGGSTEYQKILSWIVLTQMMVERAVNGTIQLKKGATDWFNFKKVIRGYGWMGADELQQEAISYMNKRRRELAKKIQHSIGKLTAETSPGGEVWWG